jgi:hypothetical protein
MAPNPLRQPMFALRCLLLAAALGLGSRAAAAEASPGLAALSEGDRAWMLGERPAAVAAWRRAASSEEPAAEAMARLRLLRYSGNLGMAVHGPRIDRALRGCDGADPWCRLASVDYHLLAPSQVGADVAEARALAQALEATLPGPAGARLVMLGERGAEALEGLDLDGLGEGLLDSGGELPAYPGTWLLGLGLMGGPGLGFGGGLRFVHPDLFLRGHRLGVDVGGTSRGSFWAAAAGASAGTVHGWGDASGSRWIWDLWDEDEVSATTVEGAQGAVGPGLRWGKLRLELGGRWRWDRLDGSAAVGVGPEGSLILDGREGRGSARRGWYLGTSWESALAGLGSGYEHLGGAVEARGYQGGPWESVLAGRVMGERAFVEGVPWYLEPSAGGMDVLRGAPAGRYRGRSLGAVDLEWRRMIAGGLEGVLFGCGAWVEGTGLHPGGGVGLRLMMPPAEQNVVRLDLGVSDAGWAVTTGWGEVF